MIRSAVMKSLFTSLCVSSIIFSWVSSGNVPATCADNSRLLKFVNLGVATPNAMEDFKGMLA